MLKPWRQLAAGGSRGSSVRARENRRRTILVRAAPHYWAPPILTSAADVPIVLALHAENERLDEHINDCTLTSCIWTLSPREAFRSTNRG